MRVAAHFRPGTHAFWCTTYSLDLALFDQYLLRQLGGSPLNAVVLADHWKLNQVWARPGEDQLYLARQANRSYLLRGVLLEGGGAFHPKTYLFDRRDETTLLVGSGNLTRRGVDAGKEVFASFSSTTEEGQATIRAWAAWIGRLVERADDEQLLRRFGALREQCPWMAGPDADSPLVINDERSFRDQFAEQLPGSVDELHVSAPYFDPKALALQSLLQATSPRELHLYLGKDTKVSGPALAAVLEQSGCEVKVQRFHDEERAVFVHAKLIGAVCGQKGLLLCGSPNLSQAALTLTHLDGAKGNCEVALLRHGTADQVRAPFLTSGLSLPDMENADLVSLRFDIDEPRARSLVYALRHATWTANGHITVSANRPPELGTQLAWAYGTCALSGQTTDRPLNDDEHPPVLAWLAAPDGAVLSNMVAIDQPRDLERSLSARDPSDERPRELHADDMTTPLGQIMGGLNQHCIFDLDDTAAIRRAQAAQEDEGAEDSDDFWERLMEDELAYDPRTKHYRDYAPGGLLIGHDLFRELEIMLAKAPGERSWLRLVTATPDDKADEAQGSEDAEKRSWSLELRQKVRVSNVLSRWCRAVSDPRHALLRPDAPAFNYEALIGALVRIWEEHALDDERLARLAGELFGAFLGDDKSPGFLGRADEQLHDQVLQNLDPTACESAAGLAYLALAPRGWHEIVYAWQPYLRTGLIDTNVMRVGDQTTELIERVLDRPVKPQEVKALLLERADYMDDAKWCEQIAAQLGFESVWIEEVSNPVAPVRLHIGGCSDPRSDARVLDAVGQAMRFRRVSVIGIEAGEFRAVLALGHPTAILDGPPGDQRMEKSDVVLTAERLRDVERQGGALKELLALAAA